MSWYFSPQGSPIPNDNLQMTLASPLPEVYTTHKVSYVNLHLKEEEIALLSPKATCSETVWFPRKRKRQR